MKTTTVAKRPTHSAHILQGEAWEGMVEEVHSMTVSEPQVAGNAFSLVMDMDMTMKQGGRHQMKELCVYETKDGKVISERFFM